MTAITALSVGGTSRPLMVMTTQLVRDSMKLMADAGVDILDIKWFDLTGAFSEHQHANLEPVMTHRPPFDKCFVTWKGKTRSHPSYEVLMLVAGTDPNEGITVSMWKGPSGTRLRPIPAMFYFIEDDNIRYGAVSDDEPIDKELAEIMLAQIGVWYSAMNQRIEAYIPSMRPRLHERRGHLRRLKTGKNVWVKSCKVGDASKGAIFHDYAIKEKNT